MDNTYAAARCDQAASLLPGRWQGLARRMTEEQKAAAEEFRLRVGQPMTVLLPEGEQSPWEQHDAVVTAQELEQLCDTATAYSRYAAGETMSQGYVTARGGFRVGLCGTAVMRGKEPFNLRELSSAVIRIGREHTGVSEPLLPRLLHDGLPLSTLILAPPGLGKTTFLRDLIRNLSDGTSLSPPLRVALVDERGELAGMFGGMPQLAVGRHTDVLNGCPKAAGIPMLLRAANPQVIAVDEITVREDIAAMTQASHCGVRLLATVHAGSVEEMRRNRLFGMLLRQQVFSRAVVVSLENNRRRYMTEELR